MHKRNRHKGLAAARQVLGSSNGMATLAAACLVIIAGGCANETKVVGNESESAAVKENDKVAKTTKKNISGGDSMATAEAQRFAETSNETETLADARSWV